MLTTNGLLKRSSSRSVAPDVKRGGPSRPQPLRRGDTAIGVDDLAVQLAKLLAIKEQPVVETAVAAALRSAAVVPADRLMRARALLRSRTTWKRCSPPCRARRASRA